MNEFKKREMTQEKFNCSICGEESYGWGHNPEPVKDLKNHGPCCDTCNYSEVITARLMFI